MLRLESRSVRINKILAGVLIALLCLYIIPIISLAAGNGTGFAHAHRRWVGRRADQFEERFEVDRIAENVGQDLHREILPAGPLDTREQILMLHSRCSLLAG